MWYQIKVVSGFCPRCNPIARCLLFFQHPAAHCLYLRTGSTINHSSALYWTRLFSVFQPSRAWGNLLRQTTQDSTEKWSAWMQVVGLLLRFLFRPLVLPWWALKSINSFIPKSSRHYRGFQVVQIFRLYWSILQIRRSGCYENHSGKAQARARVRATQFSGNLSDEWEWLWIMGLEIQMYLGALGKTMTSQGFLPLFSNNLKFTIKTLFPLLKILPPAGL